MKKKTRKHPQTSKGEVIRARVPENIKEMAAELAEETGESESYIVRQAIREYIERLKQ